MADLVSFDAERNLLTVGDRRLVFHCHHYNVLLQRTIEDALGADEARRLQRDVATTASEGLLAAVFAGAAAGDAGGRLEQATRVFGSLGFGLADTAGLGLDGGEVRLTTSHYALGWRGKFGRSRRPVCHFAVGYFRAAVAAAHGLLAGAVSGDEVSCAAVDGEACRLHFTVRR